MARLTTIRLYGALGARFGRVHKLAVQTSAEAVKALCINFDGLEDYLMNAKKNGMTFAVFRGKRNIGVQDFQELAGDSDIRIAPVMEGAKKAGMFQTILGAVMVVAGVIIGVTTNWTGVGLNLGLGSSATRDVATSEQMLPGMDGGKLLDAGSLGFASARHLSSFASMTTGVFRYTGGTQYAPDTQGGVGIQAAYDGSPSVTAFVWSRIGSAYIKSGTANNTFSWVKVYTEANTTKASDGTLKAASPVARIVKTKEENQRTDIDEPGFVWCGCGTANAEAEGITISRLDVGVYMLTGSAGLASSGWQLLPPIDPSGMGKLGVVEAEQTDSGELTIRLFKRKYILSDEGEVIKTKGEPIDVPANSWIDVRLDMPADSIWNTKVSGSSLELQ
ncbi:TPA: hypothetical protein ACY3HP_003123 [Enterobacter kobei]